MSKKRNRRRQREKGWERVGVRVDVLACSDGLVLTRYVHDAEVVDQSWRVVVLMGPEAPSGLVSYETVMALTEWVEREADLEYDALRHECGETVAELLDREEQERVERAIPVEGGLLH